MSEINHEQFETWINRYLDGELTDDKFEQYLRSIDAGFDLEKLKSLRTRIERIEELYRQIEEPVVPDGYWDSFADRVAAKLPTETQLSLKDRFFAFFSSNRWQSATIKYAGAVASVLVILLIGKSLMKSGSNEYMPHESPSKQIEKLPLTSGGKAYTEETAKPEEKTTETVEKEQKEEDKQVGLPAVGSEPSIPPAEEVIQRVKAKKDLMQMSKPASNITITEEPARMLPEDKIVKEKSTVTELAPAVELEAVDSESGLPEMSELSPEVELATPAEEILDEALPIASAAKSLTNTRSSLIESSEKPSAVPIKKDLAVWEYDNWEIDSLRMRLDLLEKLAVDPLITDSVQIEIAEIKSSIAVTTHDSTDVYDAIGAIDSLLVHVPVADPQKWTIRRSELAKILKKPAGR